MTDITCDMITHLASKYQPLLRYDKAERFFPILAEAWLSHCSQENWKRQAGAAISSYQRGTTIMLTTKQDRTFDIEDRVGGWAGPPSPPGLPSSPIKIETSADPNAIGNPQYTTYKADEDLFLNFAGWDNVNAFDTGSLLYLDQVFSELGHSMNPAFVSTDTPKPPPTFNQGIRQPDKPVVYAEVEWAGIYIGLDKKYENEKQQDHEAKRDIGDSAGPALRTYLALTYYYLYPATRPPDVHSREGQWEAITLFFKIDPGGGTDDQRPTSLSWSDPDPSGDGTGIPRFAAYSRGYNRSDELPPATMCMKWEDVEKDGVHPIAYVTNGSHMHLFKSHTGAVPPGDHYAMTSVGDPNPGWVYSAYTLNVAGALAVILYPAGPEYGVGIGVFGLLLLLIDELFLPHEPLEDAPGSQDPIPPPEQRTEGYGDGPAAVPAGGTPGTAATGVPVGSTGAQQCILRVIDPFHRPNTGYPLPSNTVCEYPSWWDFTGRWGVKIADGTATSWDSGSRRVDKYGRSRGYWHAYWLVQFWSDPQNNAAP